MGNVRFEAIKIAKERQPSNNQRLTTNERVKDYFARDVFTRAKMKEYILSMSALTCTNSYLMMWITVVRFIVILPAAWR